MAGTYLGTIAGGGLVNLGLATIPALVATPMLPFVIGASAVMLTGTLIGGISGGKLYDVFSKSDIWKARTERHTYKAPYGHTIYADPTYQEYGQGSVKILNRDEHSFDFEITALQGKFSVNFTSYERWMHSSAKGDFEYRKSLDEYMADIRQVIAKEIEKDDTGIFDVIQFLQA